MAPLEPWEKVFVDYETFSQTVHGQQDCTSCHAGQPVDDIEKAHDGLIARPSEQDPQSACGTCHEDVVENYGTALHNTQAGYWTAINARSDPDNAAMHEALGTAFTNHCATCHTSCGECHVSQPSNVGGGLFSGHTFEKEPPMSRSCTACHGSRVGNEFMGKNEEYPGDVHFREGRMSCIKCHAGQDLHGSGEMAAPAEAQAAAPEATPAGDAQAASTGGNPILEGPHRYAGGELPACSSCHPDVKKDSANPYHATHGEKVQCQVCHSITYTSCDGCHVAVSEKSGNPFFETQATYFTFMIGLNPLKSEARPYEYALLRHVPVAPTSYEYYGADLLPNFNALSTWVYTTPHNIQRKTPQTASCDACHGNGDLFLTADKVAPEELEANQGVIVPQLPEMK